MRLWIFGFGDDADDAFLEAMEWLEVCCVELVGAPDGYAVDEVRVDECEVELAERALWQEVGDVRERVDCALELVDEVIDMFVEFEILGDIDAKELDRSLVVDGFGVDIERNDVVSVRELGEVGLLDAGDKVVPGEVVGYVVDVLLGASLQITDVRGAYDEIEVFGFEKMML